MVHVGTALKINDFQKNGGGHTGKGGATRRWFRRYTTPPKPITEQERERLIREWMATHPVTHCPSQYKPEP